MRILHVLGKLDRGGVETWLVQVLRHIDRQKYQMDFMVHLPDSGAYDEEVRSLGAQIIPCPHYQNPARYAIDFLSILRQHGPYDVVHSHVHHFSGYVLMLAKLAGVPVRIAHSHTSAPEKSPSRIRQAYLRLMKQLIGRYASLGLTVSTYAGDSLMPTWKRDPRWQLRPYGIESAPFEVAVDTAQIRARLGLRPEARVIGHIGRFVEVKNHGFIVQIAEELTALDSRTVFLLVGDGPLRPEIEAAIKRRGLSDRFVLTGIRSDIAEILMGAMDAFLFPSSYEGLGIALMEAQLAGLRCVVSNTVPPEVELVPGMVKWLPLSAAPKQWAQSLQTILNCPQRWNVPPAVREQHSIDRSVSHLTSLYEADGCAISNRPTISVRSAIST